MEPRSSRSQRVLYSFGMLANGVYNGFNNYILSLFIETFTGNPFILGYLSNTRTMEGVVIQPLVGRWSDRTTNRLGRRRPFILFGVPISVLFLFLIPVVGHGHAATALPLIAACVILFSIFWNIAGDPYQALMVDIVEEEGRSKYNAILTVLSLAGTVAISAFTAFASIKKNNIPTVVFYACGAVLLISYAIVFFGVREPKHAEDAAQLENKIPMRQYIEDLRTFREPAKLLVSIFFLWTGLNPILPYLTLFVEHDIHSSKSQAILITIVLSISVGVFAYPFGWLGARYGQRRFIVVGTVILIVAAIMGLLVRSYALLFPLAIIAGAGFSATTVLTFPYLSTLVPERKIGVFTGLQTAFSAIAVPLSTLLAGALIEIFHHQYRPIFAVLAIMMVADVFFLLSIDEDSARRQVRAVEAREDHLTLAGAPI